MSAQHNRTELNNVAQLRGYTVQYADTQSGPLDDATWDCTVYVNRIPYGRGISKTKSAAREAAAAQALRLMVQGY